METNKDIQELTPLYYVRHPDDSYSVADPQPAPVATAAMRGDPLAVLTLGGIDGEEFDSWDLEVYSGEAIDKLQEQLVRSSEPVILNLYAAELTTHPPADAAPVDAKPVDRCSKCGCTGIHACPGQPIEDWAPEKVAELHDVLSKYPSTKSPAQGDALSQEAKPVGRVIRDANGFWYFAPLIDWPAIGQVELYAAPPSQPVLTDAQIVVARAVRDAIFCTGNPCTTDDDLRRAILAAASTQADSKEGE